MPKHKHETLLVISQSLWGSAAPNSRLLSAQNHYSVQISPIVKSSHPTIGFSSTTALVMHTVESSSRSMIFSGLWSIKYVAGLRKKFLVTINIKEIKALYIGAFYCPPTSDADYIHHLGSAIKKVLPSANIVLLGDFNLPDINGEESKFSPGGHLPAVSKTMIVHKVVCNAYLTLGLLRRNLWNCKSNTKRSTTWALLTHSLSIPARYETRTTQGEIYDIWIVRSCLTIVISAYHTGLSFLDLWSRLR